MSVDDPADQYKFLGNVPDDNIDAGVAWRPDLADSGSAGLASPDWQISGAAGRIAPRDRERVLAHWKLMRNLNEPSPGKGRFGPTNRLEKQVTKCD